MQNTTYDRILFCILIGSLTHIINDILEELEVRISQSLGWTLPDGIFQPLGKYLISFASAPNICQLPDVLQTQIEDLIELTLNGIFEGDMLYNNITEDPLSKNCILNVSASLVRDHQKRISSSLERLLQDLSIFTQSLRLSDKVLSTIRRYTFSDPCISALTRMSYCSRCGGYSDFKPCLFYCINTLTGCFADLAEIKANFSGLLSGLRTLSRDLMRELEPGNFQNSYLTPFVSMAEELQGRRGELREAVS